MTLRASTAVTVIAHTATDSNTQAFLGEPVRDEADAPMIERSLRRPRVGADVLAPTPVDIGTATHLMLQHVKFDRSCTVDDLKLQLDELVGRRILHANVSKSIDLGSIDWLINQTPLGATLREHVKSLIREAPINFPLAGTCAAPLDRVMVRGRIDALLPIPIKNPKRVLVIDFKTDSIDGDVNTDPRTVIYQRQLDVYGRAIQTMLHCSNIETHIVYLRARTIVSR